MRTTCKNCAKQPRLPRQLLGRRRKITSAPVADYAAARRQRAVNEWLLHLMKSADRFTGNVNSNSAGDTYVDTDVMTR